MKKLKILTSLVLMLVLCFSVVPFVNADETTQTTYTITIDGAQTGHTYEAYQIFAGDLSSTGILSNITWGDGINGTSFVVDEEIVKLMTTDELSSAAKIAEVLAADTGKFASDSENLIKFADAAGKYLTATKFSSTGNTISVNKPGYYLIKDTIANEDTADNNGNNVVYSLYMLEVVRNVTVQPKAGAPTLTKSVSNTADYAVETGWDATHNTASIGDTVYFKLNAKLPDNMQGYSNDTYTFQIEDTLSAGLTFTANSVKVTFGGTDINDTVSADDVYYTLDTNTANVLKFDIKNVVKNVDTTQTVDKEIVITYATELNANASKGNTSNDNTAKLIYSNNPHKTDSKGHTPDSKTETYTTDIVLLKVDKKTNDPLQGVKFNIYKQGETTPITGYDNIPTDAEGKITIGGLKEGAYVIEETETLEGYNLLTGDHKITVTISKTPTGNWTATTTRTDDVNTPVTVTVNEAGIVQLNVPNKTGIMLPSTGGMGTVIFSVIGLAIMGTVVVIAIGTNKKGVKSRK